MDDAYWRPSSGLIVEIKSLSNSATRAITGPYAARSVAESFGVNADALSEFLSGAPKFGADGKQRTSSDTTAEKMIKALQADAPHFKYESPSEQYRTWWINISESRMVTASNIKAEWDEARGLLDVTKAQTQTPSLSPSFCQPIDSPVQNNKIESNIGGDLIPEMISIRADWQATNVPEGEGQDLLLEVLFGTAKSYDRKDRVEYALIPHRVRIVINLDGGAAHSRQEWIQNDEDSPSKLKIMADITWRDDNPRFTLDSSEKLAPLSGNFRYFPLCAAYQTVGQNASLEAHFDLSGIHVVLPSTITDQLESGEREHTEERLLTQWIKIRDLRKSNRASGVYTIVDLPIGQQHAS